MKNIILFFIKSSRPRFWLYILGPFLIGLAASNNVTEIYQNMWVYILFIYFLLPANVFLYGINDYFDRDTDILNQKKEDKEARLTDKKQRVYMLVYIAIHLLLSLLIIIKLPSSTSQIMFTIFVLLSTFYSTPPLRFKRWPIIDSASNILYALPGFIIYFILNNEMPSTVVILMAWLWTFAMHLFSAIPDIKPDKEAKLLTSAVLFKEKTSLIICFLAWLAFFILAITYQIAYPLSLILIIYPLLIIIMWLNKKSANDIYWYFPRINALLGFIFFWLILLTNI